MPCKHEALWCTMTMGWNKCTCEKCGKEFEINGETGETR